MQMTRTSRTKLIRVLGMLGSEHPAERASAALAADRLVRGAGTSWAKLLATNEAPVPAPGGGTKVVVRRVHEYGVDHHAAAEARMRQLRTTNERLENELKVLRRRLAIITEQERRARFAEPDGE